MGAGLASIDGHLVPLADARVPVDDPGFTVGWTVFDTAEVVEGAVPRLDAHLDRLAASAAAACVPLPAREHLADWATALAAAHGGRARLRITVSGSGLCVLTATPLSAARRGASITAVRGPHVDDPFLGGAVKHGSRAPWIVAVKRSGADEVLLVDAHGRFTEATTAGIVAIVDGVLFTAPEDGRILPSTTVHVVLDRAAALGVPVVREGARADGPWDALYVASATRWLAPVIRLDGAPLPGWDPVGRALAEAMGEVLS
ncbi:MAG: aminotransferase class IV [Alphaproteobacteria bacterium]|nr:aminotransferase class IV [Alphaproteobacteria bacterium]